MKLINTILIHIVNISENYVKSTKNRRFFRLGGSAKLTKGSAEPVRPKLTEGSAEPARFGRSLLIMQNEIGFRFIVCV